MTKYSKETHYAAHLIGVTYVFKFSDTTTPHEKEKTNKETLNTTCVGKIAAV